MRDNQLQPRQALNKAFLKVKPDRENIEKFRANLLMLLYRINEAESEEFHKNLVADFLKNTYYSPSYFINTKERNDLVIHNGKDAKSTVGVILEAKKPRNKSEMLKVDNLNAKAFQELVLYFLRERITKGNLEIRYLVATNIYEWFIFDARDFEQLFAKNNNLVKQYKDFTVGRLSSTKTDFFYREIAKPAIAAIEQEIEFTYFDLRDFTEILRNADGQDENQLIPLFKIFSPEHLLKLPFINDSNTLNKAFYSELLHIIGLTETKEGGKKLIGRKQEGDRHPGSLIENAISQLDSYQISQLEKPEQYRETDQDRFFNIGLELAITWINRVLFLKLLEAQLIKYNDDKSFRFLSGENIQNYGDLNRLFFNVLALKQGDRRGKAKELFAKVPYLNSSLFEKTYLEGATMVINDLEDEILPIFPSSVLKDNQGKRRTGNLPALIYLFEFLDAYDFSSEGVEEIQEESKSPINAAVLGLIFEKINGYKDGSFFTPGFITMYMCRETIRRAVVQKFNEAKGWSCQNISDLKEDLNDYIKGSPARRESRNKANEIINSLKICDPAVGSGHFLVSALNEIIAIKQYLGILQDSQGETLSQYEIEVDNDELSITYGNKIFFNYNPQNKESQRVQETLFHEKQTIIENCLFGVDINPNSVKICQLRLWIELLKNAYYRVDPPQPPLKRGENLELETLPNIDINIKCGNSLISRFGLGADLRQALKKRGHSIESYKAAVRTYRNAENKDQKREMERLINEIKGNFRTTLQGIEPNKKKLRNLEGEISCLEDQTSLLEETKAEQKVRERKIAKLNNEIDKLRVEIEDIESGKIYENALEWRFEFPEVLNDEGDFIGFDVVIGNPPYGVKFNTREKAIFSIQYSTVDDIYTVFIDRGASISKNSGFVALITPIFWLTSDTYYSTRNLVLQNLHLDLGLTLPYDIFVDAYVDTGVYIFSKNTDAVISSVYEFGIKDKIDNDILSCLNFSTLYKHEWANTDSLKIIFNSISRLLNIKMSSFSIKLEDITDSTRGILANQEDYSTTKLNDKYEPVFIGKIDRYSIDNENYQFINYGENLREKPSLFNFFIDERILIRRIVNRKLRIMATLTDQKFVTKKDIYIFKPNDKRFSIRYLLAIINSRFISFVKTTGSASAKKDDFTQLTLNDIRQLRVPEPTSNQENNIEKLVNQILDTKKINLNADTTTLEKEIDRLVYKLYQLTYEEVKIIDPEFALTEQEYIAIQMD